MHGYQMKGTWQPGKYTTSCVRMIAAAHKMVSGFSFLIHLFFSATGYYVHARKLRSTNQGDDDVVDCTIDTKYILYLIRKTRYPVHFQHMLPHFTFARNFMVKNGNDNHLMSDMQGLFILVSLAFMNVSDKDGDETVELIPFLCALCDGAFEGGLHKLSILLFGMALNLVGLQISVFWRRRQGPV